MSRSVRPPDYRQPKPPTQRTATMPDCEAERRNKMALHLLNNGLGSGLLDISAIRRALQGDNEPDHCQETDDVQPART